MTQEWFTEGNVAAMREKIAHLEARLAHAQSRRRKALEMWWHDAWPIPVPTPDGGRLWPSVRAEHRLRDHALDHEGRKG